MKRILSIVLALSMLLSFACVQVAATDSNIQFALTTEGYSTDDHCGTEKGLENVSPDDYIVVNVGIKNNTSEEISVSGYKMCIRYDSGVFSVMTEGTKNTHPFRKNAVSNYYGDGNMEPNTKNNGEVIIAWGASEAATISANGTEIFAQILLKVNSDAEKTDSQIGFITEKENYIT